MSGMKFLDPTSFFVAAGIAMLATVLSALGGRWADAAWSGVLTAFFIIMAVRKLRKPNA